MKFDAISVPAEFSHWEYFQFKKTQKHTFKKQ